MNGVIGLDQVAVRAYRGMCLARAFDTKLSSLYKAGKVFGGVFLGRGHEAVAAASAVFLKKGHDVYNPFIREMAGRCVWSEDALLEAARSYFGSVLGCMGGKDGNVHWGRPTQGNPATSEWPASGMVPPLWGPRTRRATSLRWRNCRWWW